MSDDQPKPRRRRIWRWVLIALAVIIILPVAGIAIFLATLDLDQYKPRITEAVQQATGRRLQLNGPISFGVSLVPTLQLNNVAFANMPGGTRPEMATVERVEIQLALLPLMSKRVELRRLVLVRPNILLETDAQGHGNWEFAPPAQPAQPAPPAQPAAGGPGGSIAIGRIAITDGHFAYHDGKTRQSHELDIRSLNLRTEDGAGPLRLEGEFALDGKPFTLAGGFGALDRLTDPAQAASTTPWPVELALEVEGARFGLNGSIAQPTQGKGWRFEISARVPELARFHRWLPAGSPALPALRNIQLALGAADVGAPLPELTDLRLSIGESDLSAVVPELRLASLNVTLPRPDQHITLALDALFHGQPLKLAGSLGAPALLLPPGAPGAVAGPYPVDLTINAGSATVTVKGAVAQPAAVTGVNLAVGVRVPDLAALAPLAGGAALPPVKDLAVDFQLAERSARFATGALLRGLRVTSSAADLAGDLTLISGARHGVSGRLASNRINADAVRPPRPAGAPAQPAAPAPAARSDGRMIPDTPLPLDILKQIEADLRWTIGEFTFQGDTLKDVVLELAVQNGQAQLRELTATSPGRRVQLRATADVNQDPPAVGLAVRSDQLDAPALFQSLGVPNHATGGKVDLDLDVRGRGRSPRQIAATLNGYFGLALTTLTSRGTGPDTLLGRALQQLQQAVPAGGVLLSRDIEIACVAVRFDAQDGIMHNRALLVDSSLGKVGGGGDIRLTNETLALRLNTDLNLGILHVRAPVPVSGTFAAPQFDYGAVAAGAATGVVTGAAGSALGGLGGLGGANNPLGGGLGGAANAVTGASGAELPDCGSQLAIARSGRQGPVPASAAPARQAAPTQQQPATPARPAAPAVPQLPGGARVPGLGGLFGR